MSQDTNKKKAGLTEFSPNRRQRRAFASQMRKLPHQNHVSKGMKEMYHDAEARRKGRNMRLEAVRKRTEARNNARKKIAKKEGVHWTRVKLTSPMPRVGLPDYVIARKK